MLEPKAPLTEEQQRAVDSTHGPTAVIAGAGSGKTTVMVERYLRLLERGATPRQILMVTFTNEAADQLKARILGRFSDDDGSQAMKTEISRTKNIGTIHSLCYRILDSYGSTIGLPPLESILTVFDRISAFDRHYESWLEDLPPEKLKTLLALYPRQEIRNVARLLYDQRYRLTESTKIPEGPEHDVLAFLQELTSPLIQRLEQHLYGEGRYSFDDLENLTLRILRESQQTRDLLAAQFRYLCVDEFQDTSHSQWEILRHLIHGDWRRLFVVGDPKQSIYRFRDANVQIFLDATRSFPLQDGEVLELSANFRSEPPVMGYINQLSESLFSNSEVPFTPMTSGTSSESTSEASRTKPFRCLKYRAGKNEGTESEISATVHEINALINQGISPETICLLFRNADRISLFAAALSETGIPVAAKRTGSLFETYDILDLIHYLNAVSDPMDDYSLAAFLLSPYVGWSFANLAECLQRDPAAGPSLFDKLLLPSVPKLSWFLGVIETGVESTQQALELLFANSSYFPKDNELLLEFLKAIASSSSLEDTLRDMERWQRETITVPLRPSQDGGVKLMTVHAAKGLEFEHVFLVDNLRQSPRRTLPLLIQPGTVPGLRYRSHGEVVESDAYKHLSELTKKQDDEESKRVLYVALTRAEKTLTLLLPEDEGIIPKQSWGALLTSAVKDQRSGRS